MKLTLRDRFYLARKKLLARFKRKLIGSSVSAFIVDTLQGRFAVDPEDQGVGQMLISNNQYDFEVVTRWSKTVGKEDEVLIVGGHIGSLAIPLSKACRSLDAVEANPETFKLLELNKYLNNCGNLNLYNCAAGEKKGHLEFYASKVNSGGSKRRPVHDSLLYTYDHPDVVKVEMKVLDEVFAGKSYKLAIIDIEGSEYFALQGMQELLKQIEILQIEFIGHHLENVASVTNEQFFELLIPHFSKIEINREVFKLENFDYRNFRDDTDLIFYK